MIKYLILLLALNADLLSAMVAIFIVLVASGWLLVYVIKNKGVQYFNSMQEAEQSLGKVVIGEFVEPFTMRKRKMEGTVFSVNKESDTITILPEFGESRMLYYWNCRLK